MFDTNFDKQKLMYHPKELGYWLEQGVTKGPIYTEMELCRKCNCQCIFCGVDYLVNKTDDTIDTALARKIISDLHSLGNKSIMFSGHGESLLHPDAEEIISFATELMSASVTTNGLMLTDKNIGLIDGLEWIRFSVNGYDRDNYAHIHGTGPEMFGRVIANITGVVERKRKLGLELTIGSQLVLLDDNADGVVDLAHRLKEIGVDYFSVKPYSQHPLSENKMSVDYSRFTELEKECNSLEDDSFKMIFRAGSMKKAGAKKQYRKCYGTNFLCFVCANGDIYECNVFAGDPRFLLGNTNNESLTDIWRGQRRKSVLAFIENELDIDSCRDICRMDECNKYLWRLKHPWPHDNFI